MFLAALVTGLASLAVALSAFLTQGNLHANQGSPISTNSDSLVIVATIVTMSVTGITLFSSRIFSG